MDEKSRYLILGPGADSCSVVISNLAQGQKEKNQAPIVIYSNWLAGNLTSYNRDTKKTYSILGDMSFTEAFQWTLSFCQKNPDSIYSAAANAFVKEYYDDRDTSMPDKE